MLGGSRSRLVAGVAAAGIGLAFWSCTSCTKAAPPPRSARPEPVNVQVNLTPSGIFVFPNRTHLGEGRQFPVWILTGAPDGSCLDIKFKKEDPLEPEPRDAAKVAQGPCKSVVRRGVPKPGTADKVYEYAVTITLPDGTRKELDPDIEVDK